MIGGLLFGVGRWLIGSQAGQVVLIVTTVLIALTGWTWKVARDARAKLIGEIHALSHVNNGRVCLLHSSILRLDGLRGRTPGRGARKPGG